MAGRGPGRGPSPFRYQGCEKGATLNYDVLGLVQLPQFVKAPLSSAQYESLLRQLCSVVALCVSQDVPTSGLWFDPEGVFVTPEGRLRFVLVPVSGYVKAQHSAPLELIGWLGSSAHVSMAVGESHRHVSAVGDWARRQSVFSPRSSAASSMGSTSARLCLGLGQAQARRAPAHCRTPAHWAAAAMIVRRRPSLAVGNGPPRGVTGRPSTRSTSSA